jgi:peptidoglycan/LPS O-acetylase OafA/YrhL
MAIMSNRFLAMDGLRGLLALYILAGHTVPFIDLPPALSALKAVLSHGHAAVAVFFVLSGLVILSSVDRFSDLSQPALRFLMARARRLMPVYLLALIVSAFALSLGDPLSTMPWLPRDGGAREILATGWPTQWFWHIASHALLLQGLLPPALLPDAAFSILGPAWSLSTEWQFYALVTVTLMIRASRGTTDIRLRNTTLALLLLGLFGLGTGLLPSRWQCGRAFLPQEAAYFALGVASLALLRGPSAPLARWLFIGTLIATCLTSLAATNRATIVIPLVWTGCLAIQNPILAPSCIRAGLCLGYRLLTSPGLLWAGRISYSLYLTHAPIQRLLMLWLAPGADGDWSRFTASFLGPAIALPLLVALAVHHTVEERCHRWSRRRATEKGVSMFKWPLYGSGSNTSAAGQP